MTATYQLKFGSYEFPRTFVVAATPSTSAIEIVSAPYRDGAIISTPRLAEKIITVRGSMLATNASTLRELMDALLAAVNGGRQKLYLHTDRFIYATKRSLTTDYDPTSFDRYCDVSIDFVCDTGLFEAEDESSDTWSSPTTGQTRQIVTAGNAVALPKFAVKFTSTAAGMTLAVGSQSFSLTGTVTAGDTIEVDCAAKTVLKGPTDKMSMFDGVYPALAAGSNTLTLTIGSGKSAITSIITTWRDRWY